ncbi:hypothetical protein QUA86_22720 [Microcoleus sp. F6_B6]
MVQHLSYEVVGGDRLVLNHFRAIVSTATDSPPGYTNSQNSCNSVAPGASPSKILNNIHNL